jgi:hypothetical protein
MQDVEFNFGSFDLLNMKNGSVAEMGSGKVFFLPVDLQEVSSQPVQYCKL